MTNKKRNQFLYLAMVCLSLLLASCDGGLFGTGDGHNANVMLETGDTNGTTTGSETTGGSMTTDNDTYPTLTAFDNMQPGGQSNAPQLRVLNLTQASVQVAVNDDNNAVITDLQPEQDSGRIALPIDATRLVFTDSATTGTDGTNAQTAFHTIEPFNAVEFSITTIIMRRDMLREPNDSIDVIALTTQANSTSPTTALARLVQASALGDLSRSSTITLMAMEPNISGSDVSFEGLSYDSVVTEYTDVLPGSYTLTDADGRFASENITIEAGHVYTLVINSASAPVLRVIDDSQ